MEVYVSQQMLSREFQNNPDLPEGDAIMAIARRRMAHRTDTRATRFWSTSNGGGFIVYFEDYPHPNQMFPSLDEDLVRHVAVTIQAVDQYMDAHPRHRRDFAIRDLALQTTHPHQLEWEVVEGIEQASTWSVTLARGEQFSGASATTRVTIQVRQESVNEERILNTSRRNLNEIVILMAERQLADSPVTSGRNWRNISQRFNRENMSWFVDFIADPQTVPTTGTGIYDPIVDAVSVKANLKWNGYFETEIHNDLVANEQSRLDRVALAAIPPAYRDPERPLGLTPANIAIRELISQVAGGPVSIISASMNKSRWQARWRPNYELAKPDGKPPVKMKAPRGRDLARRAELLSGEVADDEGSDL